MMYISTLPQSWRLVGVMLLLLQGLLPNSGYAQAYTMPASGSTSITTCSGTITDNGGPTGDYAANANQQLTLVPAVAGNKIGLQFTAFAVETGFDFLYIYDGSNTSAPLLGRFDSASPPTAVYATTAAGTLTLRFTSDNAVQLAGFEATVSCVTVPPLTRPDLVIQNAAVLPGSARPGGKLAVNYTLANASGVGAGASYTGIYYSRDAVFDSNDRSIYIASNRAVTLAGNQSAVASVNFLLPPSAPPGLTVYILCVADAAGQVTEASETNNVTALPVQVVAPVAGVDLLSITDESSAYNPPPTGAVPAGGTIAQVRCDLYNVGTQTASSSALDYYLSADEILDASDALMETSSGGALAVGFQFGQHSPRRANTPVVPPGTPAGLYYVLFVVDPLNAVAETDETNNISSAGPVRVVAAGVDLVIASTQLAPFPVAAASAVSTQAEVKNIGPSVASSSAVGFYLSTNTTLDAADVLLTTLPGGALNPQQSGFPTPTLTIPANTAPGAYYLLYVADPRGSVAETDETNNVAYRPITIGTPTASRIAEPTYTLSVVPNPVAAGTQVACYISGTGKGGALTVSLHNSLGQLLHTQSVPGTPGPNRAALQLPALAPGCYVVLLRGAGASATHRLSVE